MAKHPTPPPPLIPPPLPPPIIPPPLPAIPSVKKKPPPTPPSPAKKPSLESKRSDIVEEEAFPIDKEKSQQVNEEFDDAMPPVTTLLDVSANRSKARLAHKGPKRQRPSNEARRANINTENVIKLQVSDLEEA